MTTETLQIKNMVCNSCIKIVTEELTSLGFRIKSIELGKVELAWAADDKELEIIKNRLMNNGFELLSDRTSKLISKIKTEILKVVHHGEKVPVNNKFSEFLSHRVGHDYSYISNLFSSAEGLTIEKYLILQKIEKVKELLVYNELSLNEISFLLDYSSAQYLSSQFKKITGLTPSHFKKIQVNKRISINDVANQKKL
jgi:AraC-like DNA-binding protein